MLASNNIVTKIVKFEKCNSKSNKKSNIVWNGEYYLPLEQCKIRNCLVLVYVSQELIPKANPQSELSNGGLCYNGNLEYKLCFKICHRPWSELCTFHYCLALHDSHRRESIESWYKRLAITSKNGVWPRKHRSTHRGSSICRGKGPCINVIFCSCC